MLCCKLIWLWKASRTSHEGKEVTSLVQYFALNKSDCGKASRTSHEGKEVTGSVQYSAIKKSQWGKASRAGVVARSHSARRPLSTHSRRVGHSFGDACCCFDEFTRPASFLQRYSTNKTEYRITTGGETNAESRDKGTHNAAEQQELPSVFAHYNASQVVQH